MSADLTTRIDRALPALVEQLMQTPGMNADVARAQAKAAARDLMGQGGRVAENADVLLRLHSLVADAQKQERNDAPMRKMASDIAAAKAQEKPSQPPSPISAGSEYAQRYAETYNIDLSAHRSRFAAIAKERAQAAFRAQDSGNAYDSLARQAHHFALLAGLTPDEHIVALSQGHVATDDDFR